MPKNFTMKRNPENRKKNVDKKSPAEIAVIELEYNMIPYLIKRPMPNNTYEIWKRK